MNTIDARDLALQALLAQVDDGQRRLEKWRQNPIRRDEYNDSPEGVTGFEQEGRHREGQVSRTAERIRALEEAISRLQALRAEQSSGSIVPYARRCPGCASRLTHSNGLATNARHAA